MKIQGLTAISPIDGRYRKKVEKLDGYFSEFALIRYRVLVEIEYFIALCKIPLPQLAVFDPERFGELRALYADFSLPDAEHVKEIEKTTNHDVKAVEYFLREKFNILGLGNFVEYIHFGLTSQDINNTATPYALRDALCEVYYPWMNQLIEKLNQMVLEWADIPMLARTHGQPASPTRLGKEFKVFSERLTKQFEMLKTVPCAAKFGGATGNFNAHVAAFPEVDWVEFSNNFVNDVLKLESLQTTTQIAHYDNLAAMFDNMRRINTILIDLDRDVWTYIMLDYFKQKIKTGEVGSSAMPHKVNPIDFENSEGNLGLANAMLEHLSAKLPISRLQRDLTDSTVLRNIGVPFAHSLIAIQSLLTGLEKLILNEQKIADDLENNWMVVAEGIQTILRRENYPDPYGALKELTRTNKQVDKNSLHRFIDTLDVPERVKRELFMLSPTNYIGV